MAKAAAADWALVERFRQGDRAAFDELVVRYSEHAYKLARNLTGHQQDAEDAAQEAFVRIYRSLSRFRGASSFSTWLYRVVVNVCADEMKHRGRRPIAASSLGDSDPDDIAPRASTEDALNPVHELERSQRDEVVRKAVESLPKHLKVVVVLCDMQGLSYEEAAAVLGMRMGTVKSRLHRARIALRDALEPYRELLLA
jgi:RNA polymerase sigma-70 factor (ECF subfamily)